jgi:multidrug efflux pump subunit AcrA (membrane-fusion protein)
MVDLVADGRIERRAIRLGRAIDGDREVLSGLRAGDRVMIGRGTTTAADEIAR